MDGLPTRFLPNRGLPSRAIPDLPAPFVSNAEQIGQVPERGVPIGANPLYGIVSTGTAAPFSSDAEQVGAIPKWGIPIGGVSLRGIPIVGSVGGSGDVGEKYSRIGWPYQRINDGEELMELMELIVTSGILNN